MKKKVFPLLLTLIIAIGVVFESERPVKADDPPACAAGTIWVDAQQACVPLPPACTGDECPDDLTGHVFTLELLGFINQMLP